MGDSTASAPAQLPFQRALPYVASIGFCLVASFVTSIALGEMPGYTFSNFPALFTALSVIIFIGLALALTTIWVFGYVAVVAGCAFIAYQSMQGHEMFHVVIVDSYHPDIESFFIKYIVAALIIHMISLIIFMGFKHVDDRNRYYLGSIGAFCHGWEKAAKRSEALSKGLGLAVEALLSAGGILLLYEIVAQLFFHTSYIEYTSKSMNADTTLKQVFVFVLLLSGAWLTMLLFFKLQLITLMACTCFTAILIPFVIACGPILSHGIMFWLDEHLTAAFNLPFEGMIFITFAFWPIACVYFLLFGFIYLVHMSLRASRYTAKGEWLGLELKRNDDKADS